MEIFDGMTVLLGPASAWRDEDELRVIRNIGPGDWIVEIGSTGYRVVGPVKKEAIQMRVNAGLYTPACRPVPDKSKRVEMKNREPVQDFGIEMLDNGDFKVVGCGFKGAGYDEHRLMPGGSPVFPSSDGPTREASPVVTGCLDYFPLALLEIARFSRWGNDKHNPGEPLHWSRGKSIDHANKIGRHLIERGTLDPDTGYRFSHSVGLAWRALALLQKELELAQGYDRDAVAE